MLTTGQQVPMGSITIILGSQWGELIHTSVSGIDLTSSQVTKVYVNTRVQLTTQTFVSLLFITLTIVFIIQKGKLTDYLLSTNSFDVCARAQGGHNAGHSVK